jgi:hypothetical protein|tara:strand:+ start:359 stop:883 length:525 start_codon:yes stop_codon:yes gene_type:complete
MKCEIEEENVNYLVSRCRRLENIIEKFKLKIEDKDITIEVHEERIKELEEQVQTDDESIDDKKIILMQSKRINELKTNIEQLETFELDNIELKNAIKLAHERIEEFKSGEIILMYKDTLEEQQARIKELLEFDQNLNKAGVYRFTKDLEDTIVHLKVRIKELERNIEQLEMELQ